MEIITEEHHYDLSEQNLREECGNVVKTAR